MPKRWKQRINQALFDISWELGNDLEWGWRLYLVSWQECRSRAGKCQMGDINPCFMDPLMFLPKVSGIQQSHLDFAYFLWVLSREIKKMKKWSLTFVSIQQKTWLVTAAETEVTVHSATYQWWAQGHLCYYDLFPAGGR